MRKNVLAKPTHLLHLLLLFVVKFQHQEQEQEQEQKDSAEVHFLDVDLQI